MKAIIYIFIALNILCGSNISFADTGETNIVNINEIKSHPDIKRIDAKPCIWVGGDLCLPDSEFPDKATKARVKGTPSIYVEIAFNNDLNCFMKIAGFDNEKHARLGFLDVYGISSGIVNRSLLSGKTIKNANIITYDVNPRVILAFIIYKNYVCMMRFIHVTEKKLLKEYYGFIDDFIVKMVDVIDKAAALRDK